MNTTIQIRTNQKLKRDAKKILEKRGLSLSFAINTFLQEVRDTKGEALKEVRYFYVPESKKKLSWREEMEIDLNSGNRYANTKEMWADLKNW